MKEASRYVILSVSICGCQSDFQRSHGATHSVIIKLANSLAILDEDDADASACR